MVTQRRLDKIVDQEVAKLKPRSVAKEDDPSLRNLLRNVIEEYKSSSGTKDFFSMVVGVLARYDSNPRGRSSDGAIIAAKIKEYRVKHNLSQVELAEKLQCDRRQIVRWESGRHIPGRLTIRVLKQQGIV